MICHGLCLLANAHFTCCDCGLGMISRDIIDHRLLRYEPGEHHIVLPFLHIPHGRLVYPSQTSAGFPLLDGTNFLRTCVFSSHAWASFNLYRKTSLEMLTTLGLVLTVGHSLRSRSPGSRYRPLHFVASTHRVSVAPHYRDIHTYIPHLRLLLLFFFIFHDERTRSRGSQYPRPTTNLNSPHTAIYPRRTSIIGRNNRHPISYALGRTLSTPTRQPVNPVLCLAHPTFQCGTFIRIRYNL